MAGVAWDAFAVFDGLGGRLGGREAAWTAAHGLAEAMAQADGPATLLRTLDAQVCRTGGATTAMLALARSGALEQLWLLGVGDSSAYALVDGKATSLLARDRSGLHAVTKCLGIPFDRGHSVSWRLREGDSLLLCTDGVDEVVGPAAVQECLAAPSEGVEAALDRLFAQVIARGAPDNATVLLLRRGESAVAGEPLMGRPGLAPREA